MRRASHCAIYHFGHLDMVNLDLMTFFLFQLKYNDFSNQLNKGNKAEIAYQRVFLGQSLAHFRK